jgi:hypothetical protein
LATEKLRTTPHEKATPDAELRSLFAPDIPQTAQLYSVLGGTVPGTILVDRIGDPRWCVVRPAVGANTFVGGALAASDLREALEILLLDDWACVAPEWSPVAPTLPGFEHDVVPRIESRHRDPTCTRRDADSSSLPPGAVVRPIDRTLLEACLWGDYHIRACGSAEEFLAKAVARKLGYSREIPYRLVRYRKR